MSRQLEPPHDGAECPQPEELSRFFSGRLPAAGVDRITAHLADCPRCTAILAGAIDGEDADAVSREVSPAATKQDSRSTGAPPRGCEGESQFRTLSGSSGAASISRGKPGSVKLWMGIAAALVAAGGVWFMLSQRNSPDGLLAAAYTGSRPFEARLADNGYGPVRVQRGTGDSLQRHESPLRTAEEQIQAMAETPAAMELRGRAELLENRYEQAIDWLTRAAGESPHDANALSDLACAYLLRGEAHQQPADYTHATDLLLEAAKLRPNDSRLLFNLALSLERNGRRPEAIDAWKLFLQQEKNSEWAAEGRERLKALERQ